MILNNFSLARIKLNINFEHDMRGSKIKICMFFETSQSLVLKINESQYIALFVVSGSIKKLSSSDYVNIYLFSIFSSIDFARWKSVVLPHIVYIVIH